MRRRRRYAGVSFVEVVVWVLLLGCAIYAVHYFGDRDARAQAPAMTPQQFADTCAEGEPQRDDLVVDWFIRCLNEISRRQLESERAAADTAWQKAGDRLYQWQQDSRAGRDPFLADYTRLRACQFGRANLLAKGSEFATRCP